jgi:hypothetical protein
MLRSSPDAWSLWLEMPETQDFRREVEEWIRQEERRLGEGEFLAESAEKALIQVCLAVGRVEGWTMALRLRPQLPDSRRSSEGKDLYHA